MKGSDLPEVYEIFDPQEPLKDEKPKEYCVERESGRQYNTFHQEHSEAIKDFFSGSLVS